MVCTWSSVGTTSAGTSAPSSRSTSQGTRGAGGLHRRRLLPWLRGDRERPAFADRRDPCFAVDLHGDAQVFEDGAEFAAAQRRVEVAHVAWVDRRRVDRGDERVFALLRDLGVAEQ